MSPGKPQPVLLYDGDCGLCNRIVRRLLRSDGPGRLHYAPLQGGPAQRYLRAQGLSTEDFDSLVFVPDWNDPVQGGYRLRTDGALAAASVVGGVWRLVTWLRVLPGAWRDAGYRFVARMRYALFGGHHGRPLWEVEPRDRFLV